jgi:hypothetical protein
MKQSLPKRTNLLALDKKQNAREIHYCMSTIYVILQVI